MHRDGAAGHAVTERDRGHRGDHCAEVGDQRSARELRHRHRSNRLLDDVGTHGSEVRPRPDRVLAKRHRGLPEQVVETGLAPPAGVVRAVDVFGVVDGVELRVALGAGQPLRPRDSPRPVGHDQLAGAIGVFNGQLRDHPALPLRTSLANSVPVVEKSDGVGGARLQGGRHIRRLVVLRVGIVECLAPVHHRSVDPQLVLMIGRNIRTRPHDGRRTM